MGHRNDYGMISCAFTCTTGGTVEYVTVATDRAEKENEREQKDRDTERRTASTHSAGSVLFRLHTIIYCIHTYHRPCNNTHRPYALLFPEECAFTGSLLRRLIESARRHPFIDFALRESAMRFVLYLYTDTDLDWNWTVQSAQLPPALPISGSFYPVICGLWFILYRSSSCVVVVYRCLSLELLVLSILLPFLLFLSIPVQRLKRKKDKNQDIIHNHSLTTHQLTHHHQRFDAGIADCCRNSFHPMNPSA